MASIVRADRPFIRSNIYSRPAHRAFNFALGNPEIAEHVIVHAGEFFAGTLSRQLGLDRSLHSFQDREEPCNGVSCDPAPSRPAPQRRRGSHRATIANAFPLHFLLGGTEDVLGLLS